MIRGIATIVLVSIGALGSAASREGQIPRTPAPLADIRAAELEASSYPAGAAAEQQPNFASIAHVGGTTDRKCVDTAGLSAARSGDFVAGPFDGFARSWQEGHTKVWWTPRYLADSTRRSLGDNGLVVRETRLDAPGQTSIYRYGEIVRNTAGFFNSGVFLPSVGRWMLVATYRANWGCFLVDAH